MLWKIYAWAFTVILVVSILVGALATPRLFTNPFDILNVALMIIGLVGVYGYVYRKNIGSTQLWLTVLIISVLYQFLYSFILDQMYGASPPSSHLGGLVTFVPLLPMFIALARYSRKSKV